MYSVRGKRDAVKKKFELFFPAFGEVTYQSGLSVSQQPYSFTGRESDSGTGLMYFRHRYYAPSLGRFVSEDPIGFGGGINFYAYCGNDPINFTDPLGLWTTGSYLGDVGQVLAGYGDAFVGMIDPRQALQGAQALYGAYRCGGAGGVGQALLGGAGAFFQGFASGDPRAFGQSFGTVLLSVAAAKVSARGLKPSPACFAQGTPVSVAASEQSLSCEAASPSGTSGAQEELSPDELSREGVLWGEPPTRGESPTTGIERIRKGSKVLARDPLTGRTRVRTVVGTFQRRAYALVKAEFADAASGKVVETIKGTPEHPFFVEGGGRVAMGQLGIGTKVITRRGPPLVVKSITHESYPQGVAVYNFEVEGDHTYFVGKANGGIWVHNQCGYDLVLGTNKGNVLNKSWNRFMQEFRLAGGARSGLGIPRRTSVNIFNDPAGFAAEAQGAKRILFNTRNIDRNCSGVAVEARWPHTDASDAEPRRV